MAKMNWKKFRESAVKNMKKEATGVLKEDLGNKSWTGITNVKTNVSKITEYPTEATERIGTMLAPFLERKKDPEINIDDETERFKYAQSFYGLDEKKLIEETNKTHRQFIVYISIFILSLFLGTLSTILYPVEATTLFGKTVGYLWKYILILPALSLTIKAGCNNWRLRTRKLGALMTYLTTPSVWASEPHTKEYKETKAKTKKTTGSTMLSLLLLFGFFIFLIPGAQAQDFSSLLDKKTDDLFYQLVNYVFPIVSDSVSSGSIQSKAIAAGFETMIGALAFIAGLMISWHTVMGVSETARSGKVMADKWNATWIPIRILIGFGSLAPVIGGFCMAQWLVLQIGLLGSNLASAVWGSYANSVVVSSFNPPSLGDRSDYVGKLLMLEVCDRTIYSHTKDNSLWAGLGNSWAGQTRWVSASDAYTTVEKSTEIGESVFDYGRVCGEAYLNYEIMGDSDFDFFQIKSEAAFINAQKEIGAIAQKIVEHSYDREKKLPSYSEYIAIKNKYNDKITEAVKEYTEKINGISRTEISEQMKRDGWAASGMYYITIMNLGSQVSKVLDENITVNINNDIYNNSTKTSISKELRSRLSSSDDGTLVIAADFLKGGTEQNLSIKNMKVGFDQRVGAVYNENGGSWIIRQIFGEDKSFSQKILEAWTIDLKPGEHAMTAMISFGQQCLTWAFIIGGFFTILKAGAGFFESMGNFLGGAGKGITGALSAVTGPIIAGIGLLGMVLLICGIAHAYILPLVPYITMTFFVYSMLILLAEGMIAAPIWAFFHIRMDGQEFIDQSQRPGYIILFNLLFRPTLAILGLMFSIQIFDAGTYLLKLTFSQAVLSSFSGYGFELIGIIVAIVIITYMHWQLAIRSFSMITQVPDRVSRWFNASTNDGMNEGQDINAAIGLVNQVEGRTRGITAGLSAAAGMGDANQGRVSAGSKTEKPSDDDKNNTEKTGSGAEKVVGKK